MNFEIIEVLSEYDGPRAFTCNCEGKLMYAHWVDEEYFIFAEFDGNLDRPCLDILTNSNNIYLATPFAEKIKFSETKIENIPREWLPFPGVKMCNR